MSCPSQRGPSVFTKKREERRYVSFPKRKIQPYTFWIPISIIKLWVHKTRSSLRRHINQINRKLWFVRTNFAIHYLSFLPLHFPPVIPDIIVLWPSYRPLWITSLLSLYWAWCGRECPSLVWCSAMFVAFWARESEQSSVACTVSFAQRSLSGQTSVNMPLAQSQLIVQKSLKAKLTSADTRRYTTFKFWPYFTSCCSLLLSVSSELRVSTPLWCSSQMDPTALSVAPEILAAILKSSYPSQHMFVDACLGSEIGAFTKMSCVFGYVLCCSASKEEYVKGSKAVN